MELPIKIKTYFKDIYTAVGFTTRGIIWLMTNTMTWPTISKARPEYYIVQWQYIFITSSFI